MTVWRAFLNDKIPDCGVAACCNAMLLWKAANPTDTDAKVADDRFSAADYTSKVLWGWFWRGIADHKLGGFATIRPAQIPDAIKRFGCAFVSCSNFEGTSGGHAVLAIAGDKPTAHWKVVSWGEEYPGWSCKIDGAYAIAPKFHPILMWWALRNNPRWFLFLAPLWWPQ